MVYSGSVWQLKQRVGLVHLLEVRLKKTASDAASEHFRLVLIQRVIGFSD